MNILIINVSLRPKSAIKLFPVGLGYIATAIKGAGFSFDLIDIDAYRYTEEQVEAFIRRKKYDVVCMGCIVTGYKIIKGLASLIRENHPHTKIIVGNSVATSIAETLLTKTKVDIAVLGEGDITVVELLMALESGNPLEDIPGISFLNDGQLICTQPRSVIKNISNIPLLDFSIFDIEVYIENSKHSVSDPLPMPREEIRALPVNTARGCIANCGFCYHNFRGTPYRYRTSESIVSEIKHSIEAYNLNYIHFWDELTFFFKKAGVGIS
ncbi:MAG: cobalamin B12-binding domain-containing protein [Nitrospirae bacterium]|nr:cobalamin B12-binding domain-containing protein [Nitrospirota bacterium]